VFQYNAKGNELVESGKVEQAIKTYSEGIEKYSDDYELYSNRSVAYHIMGDGFKALQDAKKCVELNPDFVKGYSRKAEALHYLKRFKEAQAVYEQGLEKFPGDEYLQMGLENLKEEHSVTRSARGRRASVVASMSAQRNSKAAESMSEYVSLARTALELEIASKQAQLRILNSVSKKTDEEKRSLLFKILDQDGDGFLNARELSDAVRKNNSGFSFAESLDRAMDLVAIFDKDKDSKLNQEEFQKVLDAMLDAMDVSFHEFAEFLIMKMLFSEGNDALDEAVGTMADPMIQEEVKAREEYYDAILDKRMEALFQLFDLDGSGSVDFQEVALGIYHFTNDMEESVQTALSCMLLFDQNESRSLNYEEFAQLMMNIAGASGQKFDAIADQLTLAMVQDENVAVEDIAALSVADEIYNAALDEAENEKDVIQAMNALEFGKLHKLFDLWDTDHDGFVSFEELVVGMRRFKSKKAIEDTVQNAAIIMLQNDADGDQKLDRLEFAVSIVKYAKSVEADLHDLVDFMVVSSVLTDDDEFEKAYIKAISPSATKQIADLEKELDA